MAQFRETLERIPDEIQKNEFSNLPDKELRVYEIIAKHNCDCPVYLWDKLKNL